MERRIGYVESTKCWPTLNSTEHSLRVAFRIDDRELHDIWIFSKAGASRIKNFASCTNAALPRIVDMKTVTEFGKAIEGSSVGIEFDSSIDNYQPLTFFSVRELPPWQSDDGEWIVKWKHERIEAISKSDGECAGIKGGLSVKEYATLPLDVVAEMLRRSGYTVLKHNRGSS